MSDATEQVWRKDFNNYAEAIPAAWLVHVGDWTGIHADRADDPVVQMYRKLMIVGYAKGWI